MRLPAVLMLLGLFGSSASGQSGEEFSRHDDYFACLVGRAAVEMTYKVTPVEQAFGAALKTCAAEEAALRSLPPDEGDGEMNAGDSVQSEALDALNRLQDRYDPTRPVTNL